MFKKLWCILFPWCDCCEETVPEVIAPPVIQEPPAPVPEPPKARLNHTIAYNGLLEHKNPAITIYWDEEHVANRLAYVATKGKSKRESDFCLEFKTMSVTFQIPKDFNVIVTVDFTDGERESISFTV